MPDLPNFKNGDMLMNDRMGTVPMGQPMNVKDHPATNIPTATEDYWGDKPSSERPAKPQKGYTPPVDSHTDDPWNKSFGPGSQ